MPWPERSCIRCLMSLPVEAFSPHKLGRDGLSGACKACEVERIQVWKHDLTTLERQQRIAEIDGCTLCGRTEPGRKGWVVDHDRSCCTGDRSCASCRRGILCQWCNNALGYALDNPEVLRRMAAYLELGTRIDSGSPNRISAAESYVHDVHNERTEMPLTDVYLDTAVDVHACIEDSTIVEMEPTP